MSKTKILYKCLHCGADIFGINKKYCCFPCYLEARKADAPNKPWCECCYKSFSRKQGGSNKKAGYKCRFCSMGCKVGLALKVRSERKGIKRLWINSKPQSKKPKAKEIRLFTCVTCRAQRTEGSGHWSKYCSDSCKPKQRGGKANKNLESYKRAKKAWRLKRKAMERGACIAENFHPFVVFDRDGWKCQICGIKTPKELRGSHKASAPEIDHIVPISKGGHHTMTNVQTSCRSCNAAKSDKAPIGQMGLFTSLIGS